MPQSNIFRNDLFLEKKILVTGATSGIGYESVKNLSRMGADLILNGRSAKKLYKIESLLDDRSRVLVIPKDLSKRNSGSSLIESLPMEWLPLDGMFHAAGDILLKPLSLSTREDFDNLAEISLHSILNISKFISKKKYFSKGSSIVLMSSIASILGTTGLGYYSAIKSSINSICQSMAIELAPKEIRVNTILAGAVETSLSKDVTSSSFRLTLRRSRCSGASSGSPKKRISRRTAYSETVSGRKKKPIKRMEKKTHEKD